MLLSTYKGTRRLVVGLCIVVMAAFGILFKVHWSGTSSGNLYGNSKSNRRGLIYDCITGEVRGTRLLNRRLVPLVPLPGEALESREASRASFHAIFQNRSWGPTISGFTAELHWAVWAAKTLEVVIERFKANYGVTRVKLLDVPCGDMNWMRHFLANRSDVDYTGLDIVPELIASHRKTFAIEHPDWKFQIRDILSEGLTESYDLVLNRLMLVCVVHHDVVRFLDVVSRSGSRFYLTTTCPSISTNLELTDRTGPRYRGLNLEAPPVSLPPPICYTKDSQEVWYDFQLALWKLPLSQVSDCRMAFPTALPLWNSKRRYFACS